MSKPPTRPTAGLAGEAVKRAPPPLESLPARPVLSRAAQNLGWQLFAEKGPPVLTPTIERKLGGVQVLEHHLGSCVGRRLGNSTCTPFLATVYIVAGSAWGYGPRGSHLLRPGDIATWHSNQGVIFQVDEMVRKVVFLFDVESLGPLGLDPALCDASMPHDSPLGALLSGMFGELYRQLDSMPADYHATVLAMARDAVSQVLRSVSTLQDPSTGRTLFDRIAAYIERSYHDPELSPASVAAALGISVRYLHLLFAQRGHTAAAWIRERRLAYCREALRDAESDLSVTGIAFRAGFSDASHFSRVFRRRFGMAPNQYRRLQSRPASHT